MTTENQALLDAIRTVVKEEIAPLSQKIDVLGERVDTLTERVDTLTERVDTLTERVDALTEYVEARFTSLEARVQRIEDAIETLDTRTNKMASDLHAVSNELLDLKERVKDGFSGLKRESEQAYIQIDKLQTGQRTQQKRIKALEDQVASLQRRLDLLEAGSANN